MMEIEKDNMGEKRAYKPRKPGGGRKKLKPEFEAGKNLKEQMESAMALYDSEMSLQAIADELGLNDYSGARHTGLAAPPHRNIQKRSLRKKSRAIL